MELQECQAVLLCSDAGERVWIFSPQSHFQCRDDILAPSKHWLEGNAVTTGRGKGLCLVMPHGDQKVRYRAEGVRYCLPFLQTEVFKSLLVDDLLPTGSSVSLVL